MAGDHIPPALEAILLVAEEPLPSQLLAQLVGTTPDEVDEICESLAREYERDGRGFVLVRVAGGYRYQTATDQAPYVERFVLDGQSTRLSAPASAITTSSGTTRRPRSSASTTSVVGKNSPSGGRSLTESSPNRSRNVGVVP